MFGKHKEEDPMEGVPEDQRPKVQAMADAVFEIGDSVEPKDFSDFFEKELKNGANTALSQHAAAMLGKLYGFDLLKEVTKPVEGQAQMAIVAYFMERYAREYAKVRRPK